MALYIALIISYFRHRFFHKELLLVGAECNVRWAWEYEPQIRIVSFAPEPVDNSPFDDYGWSDEVFTHLPNGIVGILRFIKYGRGAGHSFAGVSLIYASIAE